MLHVHRAASGERLVASLGDLLATPLADPFAPEVVAVPARGVERWIAQRLSHRLGAGTSGDGVCARVAFPRPDDLLDEVVAQASPEHARAVDAWQPERTVWRLLDVLDTCPDEDWCRQLTHHLGLSPTRRYAVARRLAGLFAQVGASRPALLREWALGRADVPDDLRWQPELWRRLRARLGPSPAELLDDACAVLRTQRPDDRPYERLSLYGVTRLDTARLQVLTALAVQADVHLYIHHASPALWDGLDGRTATRRADAPAAARHPLLASLSRDVRELQLRLHADGSLTSTCHDAPPAPTLRHRRSEGLWPRTRPDAPATLLGHLQADLAADRVTPYMPDPADRSVAVHGCHGRARQVEVLREAVLGLLADDPTLEPRDILVMCPDVEAFAPLVAAAFGHEQHPGGQLRVALADRSPRQVNALLAVAAALLDLARSRVTGSQVLDLAGMPAVRQRFGFDDDDVEQLRAWTVGSGVRWGLSDAHRAGWQMQGVAQGTWRSGLDRLLAGVALPADVVVPGEAVLPGDVLLGGVLPYEGADSSDVELAGRLAELVDRLDAALGRLSGRRPATQWLDALEQSVDELAEPAPDAQWQLTQLRRAFGEVRDAARDVDPPFGLADVTSLLGRLLEGRPTTTSFRTGGLTVCTLTPMRSVPHRVVCLLGLDDGAFPRHGVPDGDDVLARDPHVGERDPRSEDRQLFLDALCAAGEHLVVTYTGHDPRTGAPVPPAVPLGELLDALDAASPGVLGQVVVHHPLQPFDARAFAPGALGRPGPFSFDTAALAGARASQQDRLPAAPFLAAPLPGVDDREVELARLVEFWQSPAKGFLRQRLDLATSSRDEEPDDALPVELDALQRWAVGDRVLRARLAGARRAQVSAVEAARGDLPPGPLGDPVLKEIGERVDAVAVAAQPYLAVGDASLDVDVDLGGWRLHGTVPGVRGDAVLTTTYSTLRSKQRMRAWVELLALTVAHPSGGLRAVLVGGGKDGATVWQAGPVAPDVARAVLADLVRLRALGLTIPLPLPVQTAEGYARERRSGAHGAWTTTYGYDREDREVDNVLCWGAGATLDTLLGWRHDGLGFDDLVDRVWRPLLAAGTR